MKELVLFLFVLNIFAFAQEGTFERFYSKGTGEYVKETPDGGYLIASTGSDINDTLKSYDLCKVDVKGNLLWLKEGLTYTSDSYQFDVSSNGDIFLCGYTIDNNKDIEIVKLDHNGDLIWRKKYGTTDSAEVGMAITKTIDNNLLIVGRTRKYPQWDNMFTNNLLMKLDIDGNIIWQKKLLYSDTDLHIWHSPKIIELSDYNFVIIERKQVRWFSKDGDIVKDTLLEFSLSDISLGNEGEVYICGGKVWKYDSSKNIIYEKSFAGKITSLAPAFKDDEIIVACTINNASTRYQDERNLVHCNSKGDSVGGYKFPGVIYSLLRTSDNKLIIVGKYFNKVWVVRTDSSFIYRSVHLTSPLEGNKVKISDAFQIKWVSIYTSGKIKIELSTNGGTAWKTISNSVPDSNKYSWTPDWVISSNCKIRISDALYPNTYSESETFSILPVVDKDTLSINNISMWFNNNAEFSRDPRFGGNGFYWPSEVPHSLIYADGFIWSGKVNSEIRANGSTYRSGVVPGNILQNGKPADQTNLRFSVWKYRKDESSFSQSQKEVNYYNFINWPGDFGAPFIDEDNDGIYTKGIDKPKMIGDETAFFVVNDLDTSASHYFAGSDPIGLEFQHTIYAYKDDELLNDVVFRNVKIINKSSYQIDSMFVGFWSDGDLGDGGDDYYGCDSSLNLAYFYNGDNYDEVDYNRGYGFAPPSFGYEVLRGGITKGLANDSVFIDGKWKKESTDLGMTTFISIIKHANGAAPTDWYQGSYSGSVELFNLMSGRINNGALFIGKSSGLPIGHYPFSGDPETQTGMVEGKDSGFPTYPGDRRLALSSGPFTFAPGDTQNITIATIVARGSSNLNSVTKLKEKAKLIKQYFDESLIKEEEKRKASLPTEFELSQNYPNPFNPSTYINYNLSEKSFVNLIVYDILGNRVVTLVNEMKNIGRHKVEFRASNYGLSSGIYFYQLRTGDFVQTKKMVVLK